MYGILNGGESLNTNHSSDRELNGNQFKNQHQVMNGQWMARDENKNKDEMAPINTEFKWKAKSYC